MPSDLFNTQTQKAVLSAGRAPCAARRAARAQAILQPPSMAVHYMFRQLRECAPPAPGSAPGSARAAPARARPPAGPQAQPPAGPPVRPPAGPPAGPPPAPWSAASLWRGLKARLPGGRDPQHGPASSARCRAIAQLSDKMHHHQYQRVRDSSLFTSSRH
jgi:hypothetical protein